MSIYESLGNGGGAGANVPTNPVQMLSQLKSNPAGMLRARGFSVPEGMKSPQQIVNHLLQSGQVPQSRYMQAVHMMGRR